MKKQLFIVGLILSLFVLLTACGSGASGNNGVSKSKAFSGNLKKIEYEDLIDKLDNKESFFLLTLETTDEAFVESGLEQAFDKALGEHGIEAYYYGIETMDEDNEEVYEEHVERFRKLKEYSRFDEFDAGGKTWYPLSSGLVYVDKGEIESVKGDFVYDKAVIDWEDIQQLQIEYDPEYDDIVKDMVDYRVEAYKKKGVID